MRTRTIYEPYAWGVFAGYKHYETLPRRCHIRGRVAIHAAARIPPATLLRFLQEVDGIPAGRGMTPEWVLGLPRGVVLGTVEIIDCVRVERIRDGLPRLERAFGDYSDGRWALVLADAQPLDTPRAARGQQGWWNWEQVKDGAG